MDTKALSFALILLISFASISCFGKKDDDKGTARGSITVKIDNADWKGTNAVGNKMAVAGRETVIISGAKLLNASSGESEVITITIISNGTVSPGTYSIRNQIPNAQISFSNTNEAPLHFASFSGEVTISEISAGNVKGEFEGMLRHTNNGEEIAFTSGSFNADMMDVFATAF